MTEPPSPRAARASPMAWLGRVLWGLATLAVTVWGACALWFHVPRALAWGALAVWGSAGVAAAVGGLWRGSGTRRPRIAAIACWFFVVLAAALLTAWQWVEPSHERDWADDVARLLSADIEGDRVTVHNVRNFDWRSEADYTPRWETRHYDLQRLTSADLILSYWMGPHIAHTLVSFGFDDGQRLVFSLEIRKERHEVFSAVGGFFRSFEQVIIAADERDIVRTRSNARHEAVYLYSLGLSPAHLRTLFLGYLEAAESLRQAPSFYNTLTSNCTTIVFDLARHIAPGLPADYRLLLSGHFAEYAYDQGALARGYDYARLQALGHINPRALQADRETGSDFSAAIREGVPRASFEEGR